MRGCCSPRARAGYCGPWRTRGWSPCSTRAWPPRATAASCARPCRRSGPPPTPRWPAPRCAASPPALRSQRIESAVMPMVFPQVSRRPAPFGQTWFVDQLRAGLVLGSRFRLVGPVGGGGPGSVWRAVDESAGREVAVKALRAEAVSAGERAGLGFVFATVTALSSPGIAQVYDYGEERGPSGAPGIRYLVRDLVPGRTLEARLDEGSLPPAAALRFVASVAEALAAAHSAGVVHGNLVPANVIDGPSGVKVTDFGLSALRERLPDERFQSVLSYAAPERLSGGPATTASDMYSLG